MNVLAFNFEPVYDNYFEYPLLGGFRDKGHIVLKLCAFVDVNGRNRFSNLFIRRLQYTQVIDY